MSVGDTEASRQAVKKYIQAGLAPVPVPAGTKAPILPEWQDLRISEDRIGEFWTNGQGVGLLLGEPSGWLIDVDLDVPEAITIAGRFLPPTQTSGRESRKHSHRWYRAPDTKTHKFKGTDGETLVELRSTGCQTIVAPSTHRSDEKIVWHGARGIAEIEADELTSCVRELAVATLIARRVPPEGGRHDFALALCGFLLKRRDKETTSRIAQAAWHAAGADSREAIRDLDGIVRDTSEKIASGEPVKGGPSLEETAPGVATRISRWLGGPSPAVKDAPVPKPPPWPLMAEEAYYGLAGDIVRAIDSHSGLREG